MSRSFDIKLFNAETRTFTTPVCFFFNNIFNYVNKFMQ